MTPQVGIDVNLTAPLRRPFPKPPGRRGSPRWSPMSSAALVFALAAILAYTLHGHQAVLTSDEGILLEPAQRVATGERPYADFFAYMSPGSYWIQALVFRVLGISMLAARLPVILDFAVQCALVFWLVRRYASAQAAGLAAAVFFCFESADPEMLTAQHRWDSATLALLSVALCLRCTNSRRVAAAGAAAAYAALCTPSVALTGLVSLIWLATARERRPRLLPYLAGITAVAGVAAAYLLARGMFGPFLAQLAWLRHNYASVNVMPYGSINGGYAALFDGVSAGQMPIEAALIICLALPALLPVASALAWGWSLAHRGARATQCGTINSPAPSLWASYSEVQRVRRAPPGELGTVSRRAPSCASFLEARTGPTRPSEPSETREGDAESGSVVRASSLEVQRVRRAPPGELGTISRLAPFRASFLEARTGPTRPSEPSETREGDAESGSVVRASSSEAQRERCAPPDGSGTTSRRTPFCASSSKAQRVRPAPPDRSRTVSRSTPFCASSSEARRTIGNPAEIAYLLFTMAALVASTFPRADIMHLAFVAAPAYALTTIWISQRPSVRASRAICVFPLLCAPLFLAQSVTLWAQGRDVDSPVGALRVSQNGTPELANLLAIVRPGDSLYVHPYLPVLYFWTQARNPTHYAYLNPGMMTGDDEARVLEDLVLRPPQWVMYLPLAREEFLRVFPSGRNAEYTFPRVEAWIHARYQPEQPPVSIGGYQLLRRKDITSTTP